MYQGGGAGGSLNYKITNTLSDTAAENTIYVNTTTAIKQAYFQVSAPTENLSTGDVWFATGTRSPVAMNVVKKGGVYLYPSACQQWNGSAWVSCTAKTFLNGAWVDWQQYLYNEGQIYTDLAGNLTAQSWQPSQYSGNGNALSISKSSSSLTVKQTKSQAQGLAYFTKEIDLTPFSVLHFDGVLTNDAANVSNIQLISGTPTQYAATTSVVASYSIGGTTTDCDISSINQSVLIGVSFLPYYEGTTTYVITSIYLKP